MKEPSLKEFEILSVIGPREMVGREVAERFKEQCGKSVSYGTLYTTLRRLREAGMVESRDDSDADGRLRFFKITAKGSLAVRHFHARFNRIVEIRGMSHI